MSHSAGRPSTAAGEHSANRLSFRHSAATLSITRHCEDRAKHASLTRGAGPRVAQKGVDQQKRLASLGCPFARRGNGGRWHPRFFARRNLRVVLFAEAKVQWCSKGSAIITFKEPVAEEAVKQLNNTTIPGNTRFIDLASGDQFPEISGWKVVSFELTPKNVVSERSPQCYLEMLLAPKRHPQVPQRL